MKNLQPINIVLGGSFLLGAATLVVLFIVNLFNDIYIPTFIIVPLLVSSISFAVFYFLIRAFITDRLTLLYRSIRRKEIESKSGNSISMKDDVITNAEIETKAWTDAKLKEITRLKEQEEFRREFLGNLAHELKTPVFAIQGYILTLLDGGLEDENVNRRFLERASKATERMSTILEDLDMITRLEADRIKLDLSTFDIVALVEDVFEELEMNARAKNIQLVFFKKFDPVLVSADRNRILQVLMNLIKNSINYGNENGTTTVNIFTIDKVVTVEVSDNGPGIAEEDIPRLFERFYRVEKSRNRNEGGSGLGLAIVKHFIEAHNHTISVQSTVGEGSTFSFGLDSAKSNRRQKS